ncbi:MAG: HAD family hydrolase [Acidimicrobiales bacterium]
MRLDFETPKALSLDLDDTLLDGSEAENSMAATCDFVASALTGFKLSEVQEAEITAFREYWPTVEEKWTSGLIDIAAVGREVWRRTLCACGCTDESILESALLMDKRFHRDANVLYDDVQTLLDFAVEHQLRLALVTNGPSNLQRWKLRQLGLEDRFDAVAISGEVGAAKPDAAPFDAILKDLGTPAGDVWHIGDSLSSDVAGARAAGLVSVWLNRCARLPGASEPSPDLEVASLSKLVEILESTYAPE